MQVKIVDGKRVIQANGRDLKIMREAAGLFAFVWDNAPKRSDTPEIRGVIADAKNLMTDAINVSEREAEAEVPEAAGKTT